MPLCTAILSAKPWTNVVDPEPGILGDTRYTGFLPIISLKNAGDPGDSDVDGGCSYDIGSY